MASHHQNIPIQLHPKTVGLLRLLGLAGIVIVAAGLVASPQRTLASVLLSSFYILGVGLGAALLIALTYVSNAGWATAIRRVPEAMASNVYVGGLLMILLLPAVHGLYEWSHPGFFADNPALHFKSVWLSVPFFSVRTVVYVLLWSGLTFLMVRTSQQQDLGGEIELTVRNRRYGAMFIVVFGLTFWLASMDWIMSLEPHWYSTIFGVYNFSGSFVAGLAAVTAAVVILRRKGYLSEFVREEHLHDLGRLLFAFSTFWMYIWFSQYLLIWYANIPEETVYFLKRETPGWGTLTVLNLLFNWVIPFVALMSRRAKRNEGLLLKICIVLLVGHWIDLFWMIHPTFMPGTPSLSLWEIGPVAAGAAIVILVMLRSLTKANLVAVKDPMLTESLGYHA